MRKYTQLTEKGYTLELLMQERYSQREIAERIFRHKSTISRELRRNRNKEGSYIADEAIKMASRRRKRIVSTKFTDTVMEMIREKLKLHWSHEQISGRLGKENGKSISYELIYQYIDKDRKDGGTLYKCLPHRGEKYKKRNIKARRVWKSAVKRKLISERPPIASKGKEIGHWEGDTVEGKCHRGGIGTFVDKKSMFTVIRKVRDKSSEEMKNTIIKTFTRCSDVLKTLTVDNGMELGSGIYFANPYSPWERGLNENTNGLIRRFFPKGTDFTRVSERELIKVQNLLNNRPRRRLNFRTPKEVFTEELLKQEKYAAFLKVC